MENKKETSKKVTWQQVLFNIVFWAILLFLYPFMTHDVAINIIVLGVAGYVIWLAANGLSNLINDIFGR